MRFLSARAASLFPNLRFFGDVSGSVRPILATEINMFSALPAVFDSLSIALASLAVAACLADAVHVSLCRELFFREGIAAVSTELPPGAIFILPVPFMAPLVLWPGQGFKVVRVIVPGVPIAVMNVPSVGNWAVMALIHEAVLADDRAVRAFDEEVSGRSEPAGYYSML